ncbi:MAG: tetratricopeptide repeat protein [Anaerolineae bacterium]|nr:tetratricopeptide repeat protein [Anaerolineae bacterium]
MANPVVQMIDSIIRQIQERYERGTMVLERDMATLRHQMESALSIQDMGLQGDIELLMGRILFASGPDWRSALEHFYSAHRLYSSINRAPKVAQALMMIGVWQHMDGQLDAALETLTQARDQAEEQNYHSLIARCLSYLGTIYSDLGNNTAALAQFTEASELLKRASITGAGANSFCSWNMAWGAAT